MADYELVDLSVGMSCEREYYFTEERVKQFALLVDDNAPVHVDSDFASRQGYAGRIVHGLFVQSIISGMLGNDLPGPKSVINTINMKMHNPVLLGQTVDYKLEISAITKAVAAVLLSFSGTTDGSLVISGKSLCSFPVSSSS